MCAAILTIGCWLSIAGWCIRHVAGDEVHEAAARNEATNQLKMIGIALHNHHDAFKHFPPPAILGKEGEPLLSWRVKILPFLDQQDLYGQFHLDEPWDSEHNRPLIARMPEVYACPASKVADEYRTVYLGASGDSNLFAGPDGVSIRMIVDGTSKTIGVVEVEDRQAVVWTRPDDWMLNLARPTAGLGGHFRGVFFTTWCDAHVSPLPLTIKPDVLRALLTYDGREPVSSPGQ